MARKPILTEVENQYNPIPEAANFGRGTLNTNVINITASKTQLDSAINASEALGYTLGGALILVESGEAYELNSITLGASVPVRFYVTINDDDLITGSSRLLASKNVWAGGSLGSIDLDFSWTLKCNQFATVRVNAYDETDITKHAYRILTLTGSSGTANINIGGVDYLATYATSLSTTSTNFTTAHKNAIFTATDTLVSSKTTTLIFRHHLDNFPAITITNLTGNLNGTLSIIDCEVITSATSNGYAKGFCSINDMVKRVLVQVGDSITYGTGPTHTSKMFQVLMWNYLRSLGCSVGIDLRGFPGFQTNNIRDMVPAGYFDYNKPHAKVWAFGTNDAAQAIGASVFKANMKAYVLRDLLNPDDTTTPVIMFAPIPINNNTDEANAVLIRTAYTEILSEIKAEQDDQVGDRLFLINLAASPTGTPVFDRTDLANYYLSDGVHPSDIGSLAIFTNSIVPYLATAEGLSLINLLK